MNCGVPGVAADEVGLYHGFVVLNFINPLKEYENESIN